MTTTLFAPTLAASLSPLYQSHPNFGSRLSSCQHTRSTQLSPSLSGINLPKHISSNHKGANSGNQHGTLIAHGSLTCSCQLLQQGFAVQGIISHTFQTSFNHCHQVSSSFCFIQLSNTAAAQQLCIIKSSKLEIPISCMALSASRGLHQGIITT